MLNESINKGVAIIANSYAAKSGVPVVFSEKVQTEHTNGSSVVVPSINFDKLIKEGVDMEEVKLAIDAVFGWTLHGCYHVRCTDFQLLNRKRRMSPELQAIVNIFEDCRIERLVPKDFPGGAHTLNRLSEYMMKKGMYREESSGNKLTDAITWLLYYCQGVWVNQSIFWNLEMKFRGLTIQQYGGLIFSKLIKILEKDIRAWSGIDDVVKTARKVYKLLVDETKDDDGNQSQDNDGNQSQDNDGNQSQGNDGNQSQDNDGNQSQDNDGNQSQGNDGNQSQGNDGNQSQGFIDPFSYLIEEFNKLSERHEFDSIAYSKKVSIDEFKSRTKKSTKEMKKLTYDYFDMDENRMQDTVQKYIKLNGDFRKSLLKLLRGEKAKAKRLDYQGKNLNSRRLAYVATHDYKVFNKRTINLENSHAVHIGIDLSMSMKGYDNWAKAQAITKVFCDCLQKMPSVSTEAHALWGNQITLMKNKGAKTMDFLLPVGSTPSWRSLEYGRKQLLRSPEKDKTLIWLTDGKSDNAEDTKLAAEKLAASGINLIVIALLKYESSSFSEKLQKIRINQEFPSSANVLFVKNYMEELSEQLQALAEKLVRNK